MTARPPSTDLPRWATATGALITEPNAGKKDTGWSESAPGVGEDPPLDYFNWLQRRTYDFLKWLADQVVTTDEEQTITANKIFAPTALGRTALVGIGTTNGATFAGVGIAAEGNADRAALFLVPQAQPTNFATLDGDVYVDSTAKKFRVRINGAWRTMTAFEDREAVNLVNAFGGAAPAFGANFGNAQAGGGSPYDVDPVGFWKDANGVVHLQGQMASAGSGTGLVFTLPAGYFPPGRPTGFLKTFAVATDSRITVNVVLGPAGDLVISALTKIPDPGTTIAQSGGNICLDGISFRV
jgi:hypothetical protein